MAKIKRALISVHDKTGLVDFASSLHKLGIEIISTGGTAKALKEKKIPVKEVSEVTGSPEMFEGRVKTLHPNIFAGILARRNNKQDMQDLEKNKIQKIDLVVVNLYPFEQTIEKAGIKLDEVIEQIDIGGPSLIRAAAKNQDSVAVIVNPKQYSKVLSALEKTGEIDSKLNEELALEAFERTASYDIAIANYFQKNDFPEKLLLSFEKVQSLRYGENPFQTGALYKDNSKGVSIPDCEQLHGKELSYNNILDINGAIDVLSEFEKPSATVLKHVNPCGVASSESISEAFKLALETDKTSSFGGIVGLNRACDLETAKQIKPHFIEVVVAPDFEKESLELLKQKKNIRLIKLNTKISKPKEKLMVKVAGGLLTQSPYTNDLNPKNLKTVTKRKPTEEEMKGLFFAWKVVRQVKSNSIVLTKGERTVGIGAGQMSRVDASMLAVYKAGKNAKGSVLASDAFFPFRDGIDEAAKGGITAIIQPGGSIRDEEVIKAADENDIAMVFTGVRGFKH